MMDGVYRALGADPLEVRRLSAALHKQKTWNVQQKAKDGVDFSSLKILLFIPLSIASLGMLMVALFFNRDPALVATVLITVQLTSFAGFIGWSIFMDLMGDEDYRIVASWPIRANSFLIARLHGFMRNGLILAGTLCGPACIFAFFGMGAPVLTGLTLTLTILLTTIAALLILSACVAFLMRVLGPGNTRILVVLTLAGLMFFFRFTAQNIDVAGTSLKLTYQHLPEFLPSAWLAAPVGLSAGQAHPLMTSYLGMTLLLLVLIPIVAFRFMATGYTRSLADAAQGPARARWQGIGRLLGSRSQRPADRVLTLLTLAHARNDWRFRMQFMIMPLVVIFIAMSAGKGGEASGSIFGDPFVERGMYHASMLLMILIMIPPILSLPIISQSSNHQAAWLLRQGLVDEAAYRLAVRRLCRRVFLYPYVVFLGVVYLANGMNPLHLAAHLFMLGMLGEAMTAQMQVVFSAHPYSKPPQDEELALRLMPVVLGLEIFGGLIAWTIYMFAYRWWWFYLIAVALIYYVSKATVSFGLDKDAEDSAPTPTLNEEPKATATPLITAVRGGHFAIVDVLLRGGADPHAQDAAGRSALDYAREVGDEKILGLFAQYVGEQSG